MKPLTCLQSIPKFIHPGSFFLFSARPNPYKVFFRIFLLVVTIASFSQGLTQAAMAQEEASIQLLPNTPKDWWGNTTGGEYLGIALSWLECKPPPLVVVFDVRLA